MNSYGNLFYMIYNAFSLCMTETSCAISAASQFSPLVDFADLDGNLLISNDRFKGVEVVKGKITLNDLPGIGVMKI